MGKAGLKHTLFMLFLCVTGALLNITIAYAALNIPIPVYLDTVLTMTMTFYGGLFWGVLTGTLTNLISHTVWFYSWGDYLFTLCNIAVALITALFIRIFPGELIFGKRLPVQESRRYKTMLDRTVALTLLSFALCLVISIMGGIIAASIKIFNVYGGGTGPELFFSPFLHRKNLSVFIVEILSRIPVNIIDRLISSFGGYGLALLLAKRKGRVQF
ncbi:hypothetical protein AGMMS50293_13330 [Spirochaetia bacterium]|nr:hypothetical protein AGMMS50293_13330 [Spirochaetia bacterium]